MKPGDSAYIIENNNRIVPVRITSTCGGMYTCKLPTGGAIRLNKNRIYETEEEASAQLSSKNRAYKSSYDFL